MNNRQINEVRGGARAKLRQVRAQNKSGDPDSLVMVCDKHDSIPRALFLDTTISAGAARAYCVLVSHSPIIFPGMRSLGRFLGGPDGAVRTTDELFLAGWITKEVVRESGKQQSLGTIYVCLPSRLEPTEMASLDCGWGPFVVRLARPARSKNDKKAALRRRAAATIESHHELFREVFTISESEISESEIVNERFIEEEVRSKNKSSSKETGGEAAVKEDTPAAPERLSCESAFGIQWTKSHSKIMDEARAVSILKKFHINDAGMARHILSEWAAEAARGFHSDDPASSLVWLCKRATDPFQPSLGLSKAAENNMTPWL